MSCQPVSVAPVALTRSSWRTVGCVLLSSLVLSAPLRAQERTIPIGQGVMGVAFRQQPPSTWTPAIPQAVCAPGTTVEGVDVSKWQSPPNTSQEPDWPQVKAAGRGYAVARVSDGATYLDPNFDGNWAGIKAAGLVRGAYQFFRPSQDAVAQADLLLADVGALGPGDLAPTLDVEVTDGQSNATIANGIAQWTARIRQVTGLTPIIYTRATFWSQIGNPDFSSNELWVAHWGVRRQGPQHPRRVDRVENLAVLRQRKRGGDQRSGGPGQVQRCPRRQ